MRIVLVWIIICAIWSSTWIFIKLGLNDLPPVSFAAFRFLLASAILLLILKAQRLALPRTRREWTIAAVTGLFQFFINYALLFWGEQHISSGLAAVLQATIPAFGLILAQIYVPGERITGLKVFAILLGIAGVGVIFYEQLNISGTLALLGCAAVIVGAFFAAYASVLTKAYGGETNATSLLTAQMICGTVPLALLGFVSDGNPLAFHWTWMAAFCVLYLAIAGSIAAFWLYYWLLRRIEVTKAMLISLITPLAAVIIGSLTAGETLHWQAAAGGSLILLSIGLILFRPKAKQAKITAPKIENIYLREKSEELCSEAVS